MAEATETTETAATETPVTTTTAGTPADTTTTEVQGYWKDDWRDRLAGTDEKARKQLDRYASPEDIWKKARAFEQRLSSGELKLNKPFPENGTDVDKLNWRKDNGIPDSFDKYDTEGVTIGDDDKPRVEAFLKDMHASNMHPKDVKNVLASFFKMKETTKQENETKKQEITKATEDTLRGEWGSEYRKNESLIDGLLAETLASEDLRGDLGEARKLNPDFAKWMLGVALQLNPVGTVLPGTGGTMEQSIADQITALHKMQSENPKEFWSPGGGFEKLQQLTEAQTRLQGRKAA